MSGKRERDRDESINAFGQGSSKGQKQKGNWDVSSERSSTMSEEDAADILNRMQGDTNFTSEDKEAMVDRVVNIYQAFEDFNQKNGINLSTPSGQIADDILNETLAKVSKGEGAMDVVNDGKESSGGKKKRRKRGGGECTSKDGAALLSIFMVFIYNKEKLYDFLVSYLPNVLSYVPDETNIRAKLLIKSISRQIEGFFNGLISGLDAAITWNSTAIVKAIFDVIENNLTVAALTSLLAYFNIKSFTDAATYAKDTVAGVPGNLYEKIKGFILLLCGYIADAREALPTMKSSTEMSTQTDQAADEVVENDAKLKAQKTKITDFFAAKSSSGGAKKKTRKARKGKKAKKTRKVKKSRKTRRVKKTKKGRKTRARKSKK